MRTQRIALGLTLLLLLGLAASYLVLNPPSKGPSGAKVPSPEVTTLRVGYIPVTHCLPLFVAHDQGFFAAENLEIKLVSLAGGAKILEALAAGEVDIGFSNVVSAILGRSQGLPFVIFTGGPVEDSAHRDHALLVPNDSSISKPEQLRGRRIAINSRRNIDHLMILLFLRQHGIEEGEVELMEVPFPRMLGALSSGKSIDAAAAAEPFITLALATKEARVLAWNYTDVRDETFVSAYVAKSADLQARMELFNRFRSALARGTEIVESDPTLARQILTNYTRITPEVAEKVNLPRFEPQIDTDNLEETVVLLRETGLLTAPVDPEDLFLRGATQPLEGTR